MEISAIAKLGLFSVVALVKAAIKLARLAQELLPIIV
jgi:hypothetical protein